MSQSHTPAAVGDDTVMPADGNSGIAARMQNPDTEHQTGTAVGNTALSTLQDEFEAWLVANCTSACQTPHAGSWLFVCCLLYSLAGR